MIARDSITVVSSTTTASFSYAHTVAGSNRIIFVMTATTGTVTDVTYNGSDIV